MFTFARTLCLMLGLGIAGSLFAAGPADNAEQVANVMKMRMVSIEVSIVELAEKPNPEETLDAEASQKLISRIKELETQGKLAGLTRVRLSTLENSIATSQTGARAPAMTGRNTFPGQRGGEGPQSRPMTSAMYQLQDFGTLVAATPRIEPGDTIVIDLQIEKSSPGSDVRPPNTEPPRVEGVVSARMSTITFRSTVRVTIGQTVIIQGSGTSSPTDGGSRTVILLTARAEPAPKVADATPPRPKFTIYHLRFAQAGETAELLRESFPNNRVKASSDPRTNAVIVNGDDEDMHIVEGLIKVLDQESKKETVKSTKKEPE